jgi:hypothetical protein
MEVKLVSPTKLAREWHNTLAGKLQTIAIYIFQNSILVYTIGKGVVHWKVLLL